MALKKLVAILGGGARRAAEETAQEAASELVGQHREEIGQLLSRANETLESVKDVPEALARLERIEGQVEITLNLLQGLHDLLADELQVTQSIHTESDTKGV